MPGKWRGNGYRFVGGARRMTADVTSNQTGDQPRLTMDVGGPGWNGCQNGICRDAAELTKRKVEAVKA